MGKNSSHKAMQAQRYSAGGEGGGAGGGEAAPSLPLSHQEADVTYHTAEWHAARIAALQVRMYGRCRLGPWRWWRCISVVLKGQRERASAGKDACLGHGCNERVTTCIPTP